LQLLFQLPFLARLHLVPKPKWGWHDEGVQKIVKLMIPALFGVSVSQINLLLDTVLASFLKTGSVSWLYFSDRLMELPLGVFGIAIGTVILPSLSQTHAERESGHFSRTLDWAFKMVLLVGLPATIALFILAEPILATLFQYGQFSERDVMQSALSLRAYSGGLLAFMLIKVLAPGYFARQDTKTPVKIAIKTMIVNMVLNLIFILPLAHAGLALATSISALLNAALLFWGLKKAGVYQSGGGWLRYGMQLGVALTVMSGVLIAMYPNMSDWFSASSWDRAGQLAIIVVAGGGAYFSVLLISGVRIQYFRAK